MEAPATNRYLLNLEGRRLGYGGCLRCADTWNWKPCHVTRYVIGTGTGGVFPLCEECWLELSVEHRLVFYEALFIQWRHEESGAEVERVVVLEAVRGGG